MFFVPQSGQVQLSSGFLLAVGTEFAGDIFGSAFGTNPALFRFGLFGTAVGTEFAGDILAATAWAIPAVCGFRFGLFASTFGAELAGNIFAAT